MRHERNPDAALCGCKILEMLTCGFPQPITSMQKCQGPYVTQPGKLLPAASSVWECAGRMQSVTELPEPSAAPHAMRTHSFSCHHRFLPTPRAPLTSVWDDRDTCCSCFCLIKDVWRLPICVLLLLKKLTTREKRKLKVHHECCFTASCT